MKIKTAWIFPGYNVGVSRQPAKVSATITVYETANPEKILFSTDYIKVKGGNGAMGYDFNTGFRISESYAIISKDMAKYIKKKANK